MEKNNVFAIVGLALFSIFGACAKWLHVKDKEPQSKLLREAVTAAFVGFLVYFGYMFANTVKPIDISVAFIIAGFAGWGGAKAVEEYSKWIEKKSGLPVSVTDKSEK